jgi:hypothetical protein
MDVCTHSAMRYILLGYYATHDTAVLLDAQPREALDLRVKVLQRRLNN